MMKVHEGADLNLGLPLQSEAVLNDISAVVPAVYDALERAVMDSAQFFEDGEPIDPYLFPNLVRYYAHKYLENAPKEIDGFSVDRLSNNGLFLIYGGYHIRVWKADEGQLPAPGTSERRIEFFEQPELFPGMRVLKLAIIWDVSSKGTLKTHALVCPKGDGNPSTECGQSHWQIEVPHPATSVTAHSSNVPSASDDLELEAPASLKRISADKP